MNFNIKKPYKDSRGIAHLFLILLVAGVIGVAGVAFWRISSYNKKDSSGERTTAPNGSEGNTADVSEECLKQTGDENICRLGAITDLSQYSSVVTVNMGGTKSVIKYDGKGNSDATVGNVGRSIVFDGKNYVYVNNTWYDAGNDSSQLSKDQIPDLGFATTAGIKYENLGKEPCGGDTCFKYRMTGGVLGDGVVVCWFGDEDYLPRRYESSGGGLLGKMTMTIEYKPVTVKAPEGAKPLSSAVPGT